MASSVKELHGSLRMAFRLDADADPFIKRELEQMFADFGPDRSQAAVMNFIRSEQFFSIAKMRDYVPAAVEPGARLFDPNCRDCDEGWAEIWFDSLPKHEQQKLVDFYGLEVARMHTQRKRCHCWRGQVKQ